MNIIGYSGLHHSVAFKKEELPGLSAREYRIAQGFDAAAALVSHTGIRAAAAEERFTGQKGTNAFPVNAIHYCLKAAGLSPSQVDVVAHGFSYEPFKNSFDHNDFSRRQFTQVYAQHNQKAYLESFLPDFDWSAKLVQVSHHLAHAASAYYVSGFDEALIVVNDGMGEIHSTTIAVGRGHNIDILQTVTAPHSLGILYGIFTLYLGFYMSLDEYKVMGLAPYGNPRRFFKQVMDFIHLNPDGTYTIPLLFRNSTTLEKETYSGTLQILVDTFGPQREPDSDLSQDHMDIAAALQAALQATLMHMLRHFKRETGLDYLCLAGGVALNCTANGVVKRSRMFKDMFTQPAAADDGTALGAALYVQHQADLPPTARKMAMPFWGPEFSPAEVKTELDRRPNCHYTTFDTFDQLAQHTAQRIAGGEVVAWFQGRMEYGPRALGNRSILADPRGPDMRDHINRLVKKREGFRPFAPAVTIEAAPDYFEIDPGDEALFAHMLCVTQVRPVYRQLLPAITHVDGSARVQVVSSEGNSKFWTLLNIFKEVAGWPVLLNTSFNLRGQPIICTPATALDTFLSSDIDALVIENFLVTKNA